jgi:hypothetical protein
MGTEKYNYVYFCLFLYSYICSIFKENIIELQIAFKQEVLKFPKDLEDVRHLEKIAESYLDNKMIEKYREIVREFYKQKSGRTNASCRYVGRVC